MPRYNTYDLSATTLGLIVLGPAFAWHKWYGWIVLCTVTFASYSAVTLSLQKRWHHE